MTRITQYDVYDLRFPTSVHADGSDAMNKDGDHSAAYVTLRTDRPGLEGHGFTFTIGRGTDVCVQAIRDRVQPLLGMDLDEATRDLGGTYRMLASDTQLRWIGPDKGAVHLAQAAVMNAVWDLAAKAAGKPVWEFVTDMSSEEIVDTADMSYLADEITPAEAVALLEEQEPRRAERIAHLEEHGFPCYSTAAGWLGYSDEKMRRLIRKELDAGTRNIKLKVGGSVEDDIRRCGIAREMIGPEGRLMLDANQVWDVPTAIEWMGELARFDPYWIEEPTHPDDILGHARIREGIAPIKVATGEHGMNRILHKQMMQAGSYDFCQIDACRLASVNEVLAVLIMAARRGIPVCPHAGGVGLCELIQHLIFIDYVAISGTLDNHYAEYIDHLHEHFLEPCVVRDGSYRLPRAPGYSSGMRARSLADYSFPDGRYWAEEHPKVLAARAAGRVDE
ncbi:enolase C-terminal domain-like protein [uncultured Propionibacterium sp.]|uniref:enolase C-terminal domain-like protein n=1 Tax=uncultured Propionibacterium sp. TaxID=218066 RepID=UPI00293068F0|nr:enolase C-terminal domain-like protein [uncultured Propionibacterium sp.]